jgi:hypothetical protein
VGAPSYDPGRFAEYQGTSHPLQETLEDNQYDSFVWPLFMEQEGGDGTVANAWAAIDGKGNHAAITDAIDSQLPFKAHFRDFAVRDWNDDELANVIGPMLPLGAVGDPRREPDGARRDANAILRPNQRGDPLLVSMTGIRSLAIHYRDLQVDHTVGQVNLDFSGLGPRGSLDIDLLAYTQAGGWQRHQVVDDKIQFCRNVPADAVTEIVVVLSNHDKAPASMVVGEWTAESLKDPCPKQSTADIQGHSVFMQHNPQYDEHSVRIANLPDTVTTVDITIHLVIVYENGEPLAGIGSTFTIHKTITGTNPEPAVDCQGSVGLWFSQAPSPLADPDALGDAHIQGDPSALSDTELEIDFQTNNQRAPSECLGLGGTFRFKRVDDHTWTHQLEGQDLDPDRINHSSTYSSSGTINVP